MPSSLQGEASAYRTCKRGRSAAIGVGYHEGVNLAFDANMRPG